MSTQKLELTWIGKGEEPKIEPRILVENPEYSCGDSGTANIFIHGDNLLALKALEQNFFNKVKFVYIDPPFNTGAAFDHYDDGIEHSIWLDLMYRRLQIIHKLLHKSGSIMIHLDDNESDYCKIICDEIFKRNNFINRISIDARSPSAFSTVNPGVFKASEYILWYAKDKNSWISKSMRIPTQRDKAYNKYVKYRERSEMEWVFLPLRLAYLEIINIDRLDEINRFIKKVFENKRILTKKSIIEYISNNFSLYPTFNIKLVGNYLFNKFKLETFNEFNSFVYPYLLDKCSINYSDKDFNDFVFSNAYSICRETEISDDGAGKEIVELKYKSLQEPGTIFKLDRQNGLDTVFILNGKQLSFYDKNVEFIDGKLTATKLLTNIWEDISWEGIANEGGVKFKKGKKPEKLLKRCIELNSEKGDIVFDSFIGSGTTIAVANKLNRRWIGVELGEHAITHCIPRLKRVIDGSDQTGISKLVQWKGGGGFKCYTLAPSLLNVDKYGHWIISKEYNATMLAAAMAKQEGFRYSPDENVCWKQGKSSEKDFIYTTTQFITIEMLDHIHDEMNLEENLLIACKAFAQGCERKFENISIKKIPQMLLGRCEFAKDDYSLNIVNLPANDNPTILQENNEEYEPKQEKKPLKKRKEKTGDGDQLSIL